MRTGHGAKIGRKAEQAIAALLSEPTVEAAARACKVSYRQLKHWLAEPSFKRAYSAARQQVLDRTIAMLLATSGEAVAALRKNLSSDDESVVNRAAGVILSHLLKGVEAVDVSERIAALEGAAE